MILGKTVAIWDTESDGVGGKYSNKKNLLSNQKAAEIDLKNYLTSAIRIDIQIFNTS